MQRLRVITIFAITLQLIGCATSEKISVNTAPVNMTSQAGKNKAAVDALQLQGQPYVPGGESPAEGFDCSGLVYYVYNKQGIRLPRDTWSLANQLPSVHPSQRQPGDLLFFTIDTKQFAHVGIYVGQDKFVHAPSSRTGKVMLSDLKQPYWRERFTAVRRPLSQEPLASTKQYENLCSLN